ncbi:uncharacterized protein LOC115045595 [Echeneis naucrates]|uniref:uncharacterized protein LOC115045595 n=1 Tax=Echeneis naucrates TaxID=173247 RepID=UPI0011137B48|nr:uncharacterized protein LOC115045595 [Echeneis naucrates]
MEKNREGEMRMQSKVCSLLLALLLLTASSSAQSAATVSPVSNTATAALTYLTRPADVTVAVGEPAVFRCGVPEASPNLTFIFYGSHGNYSLSCPRGHVEDIPQALYGSCDVEKGESMAVWTLRGTSFPDNGTRVVCQQSNNPDTAAAVLRVYDNGASYATLIGCVIGGFFGILLVFGLSYTVLRQSRTLQKCFRGKEEEDMCTIVTKD